MDDNSTWDDNDHNWDEISLNWETCYAYFMWSDTHQKWQYSDIIWGAFVWSDTGDQIWRYSSIIWGGEHPCIEPCEPTGSIITDVGYNLAIPEVLFQHVEPIPIEIIQKKKPVKKIKKIALTIRINSDKYREEKVKRDIDYILKNVNITEDVTQKVMKISIG